MSQMLLESVAEGDKLQYIERMRRDDGSKFDVRRMQSLKEHPPELTKKMTLMEHFKNYLDETHPNRDMPLHQPVPRAHNDPSSGVYVRKWMRTRHSIIFRLSNNNFQVSLSFLLAVSLCLCDPALFAPLSLCLQMNQTSTLAGQFL